MHVDFDPLGVDWSNFISPSADGDGSLESHLQYGGAWGGAHYPIFTGIPFQRGAGVGSVFRSFLRYLIPMGKSIGRTGLETGARVLGGLLEGRELKETLASEGKVGLKNLLEKAADNLGKQKGDGRFDFKRYDKSLKEGGNINKMQTLLGPNQYLPSAGTAKKSKKRAHRRKGLKKVTAKIKRLRVDSLGNY
jgi:hypothetical protein